MLCCIIFNFLLKQFSLFSSSVKLWNCLPQNFVSYSTISSFKTAVKLYFSLFLFCSLICLCGSLTLANIMLLGPCCTCFSCFSFGLKMSSSSPPQARAYTSTASVMTCHSNYFVPFVCKPLLYTKVLTRCSQGGNMVLARCKHRVNTLLTCYQSLGVNKVLTRCSRCNLVNTL